MKALVFAVLLWIPFTFCVSPDATFPVLPQPLSPMDETLRSLEHSFTWDPAESTLDTIEVVILDETGQIINEDSDGDVSSVPVPATQAMVSIPEVACQACRWGFRLQNDPLVFLSRLLPIAIETLETEVNECQPCGETDIDTGRDLVIGFGVVVDPTTVNPVVSDTANGNAITLGAVRNDNDQRFVWPMIGQLQAGRTYQVTLDGVSTATGLSVKSFSGQFSTAAATVVPPIEGFQAIAGPNQVTLRWDPPTDAQVTAVSIRRATAGFPATPLEGNLVQQPGNGDTEFIDYDVSASVPAFYSIFALDASSTPSAASTADATPFFAPFTQIAAGNEVTLALREDPPGLSLWGWGSNDDGQLGNGETNVGAHPRPIQIGTNNNWVTVAVGATHSMAVDTNGRVWYWGGNAFGQLGNGTTTELLVPTLVYFGPPAAAAVAGGIQHSLIAATPSSRYSAGDNSSGQLGDGMSSTGSTTFVLGDNLTWVEVWAEGFVNAAIDPSQNLFTWGDGSGGILGTGGTGNLLVPTQVAMIGMVEDVCIGAEHMAATTSTGELYTWGQDSAGQLGNGVGGDTATPVSIGNQNYTAVACGADFTVATRLNGTLWAFGNNASGQLGTGDAINYDAPVQVGADTDWVDVVAGNSHVFAVKTDLHTYAWGTNSKGELGLGNTVREETPIQLD